jgi:hypothetical protein
MKITSYFKKYMISIESVYSENISWEFIFFFYLLRILSLCMGPAAILLIFVPVGSGQI